MSGLFKSKTTSTSTSSSEPWSGAQPGLSALYGGAVNQYQQGPAQYYPGQTVANQSWDTQQGAAMLRDRALRGSPELAQSNLQQALTLGGNYMYGANPAFNNLVQNANFNANNMAGMSTLNHIGAGMMLGDTAGLQGLQSIGGGAMRGQTAGLDTLDLMGQGAGLGQTAGMGGLGMFGAGRNVGRTAGQGMLGMIGSGAMLNANPYVDDMFNNAAQGVTRQYTKNVMPQLASMFSGAGRYGSESMADAMGQAQQNYGDQLNNLATSIYGGNYAQERGLQQQALNQLGQVNLAERGQQLSALGQQGQLSQNEIAQMMQGAQGAGSLSQNEVAQMLQGLQGAGSLSSAEQGRMLQALQTQTGNQLQGMGIQNQALGQLSQNFQAERNNQMQAMGMGPQLAQAGYMDANALMGLGARNDAYQQSLIDANKAAWDFGQNAGWQNLNNLNAIMRGAPMNQSQTNTQTGRPSPFNMIMGGLGMASGIGGLMGGFGGAAIPMPTYGAGGFGGGGAFMGNMPFMSY